MTGGKNTISRRVYSATPSYGGKLNRPQVGVRNAPSGSNARVYVGNLSYDVTWQSLKDHMRAAGEVTRADVLTEPSGRSKGCGLVEYANAEDAQTAIAQLHDTELNGRKIFVREDRDPTLPTPSGAARTVTHAHSAQPMNPKLGVSKSVYVGNLSWNVEWQDLKDHMRQAGEVVRAEVMKEPDGRSKGCGIVEFANVHAANNAIMHLNNTDLRGRLIFVREDREAGSGSGHVAQGGMFGGHGPPPAPRPPMMGGMGSMTTTFGGAMGGMGGMGGMSGGMGTNRLYVGNLDYKTKWFELKDHFRTAGNVLRADVAMEDDGVRSRGYGIVEFATPMEAANAVMQLNNSVLNGRPILVREDREDKRRV